MKVISKFTLIASLLMAVTGLSFAQSKKQSQRDKFVAEAKKYVGFPYEYGSVGPNTFDCSGYVYYTAREAVGVQLPRTAKAIYNFVTQISDNEKEPGDLLFFKTTSSGSISHIGIYIGNNQFISAISDGPNTGVIVSSLNQDYWKGKYVAAGQFLSSGRQRSDPEGIGQNSKEGQNRNEENSGKTGSEENNQFIAKESSGIEGETGTKESSATEEKKENRASGAGKETKDFTQKINFDTSLFFDWSLITPRQFIFKYRGIDALFHASYETSVLEPGLGIGLRFNTGLDVFQMPLILSLTVNDYVRFYAGPVFTFGTPTLIDTDMTIKGSVFPGIIGASVSTPKLKIMDVGIQAVQDISWTVYNNAGGSALNFTDSVAAGFVMYTGIRVSFPLSTFIRKESSIKL